MDQVAQVREKIDIVSYLSEFLTLKKAGRNFKAVCPFHNEKSPSFMVSPDRQMWHCFGCHKGGDVYTFIMEYEHIEFPEALRMLAKRAGITLSQTKFDATTSSKKETIYTLNRLAAEFYHYVLTKHPAGKLALAYLEKRGVNPKVMETFLIGFAPRSGSPLTKYLMGKKGYKKDDVIEAGLSLQGRSDVFDFFRDRLIFPLIDHRDNIVGFSGRVLTTGEPKYINTRETLVYHKGDMFFGLHMAKEAIRKENQAIVVEGEFDVIACFQEGIDNVVALKGTALTESQVRLLGRYAEKVTMCLDSDNAGQEAIRRSLPILEKRGLTTTVIVIPNGKDPDEAIKEDVYAFKKAVKQDIGVYDYILDYALSHEDPTSMNGKKAIAALALPLYSAIANEIVKEHYLRKLSAALETSYESILKEVQKQQRPERAVKQPDQEPDKKRSRREIHEEFLLSLMLQYDDVAHIGKLVSPLLQPVLPKEHAYQKILAQLLVFCAEGETFDSQTFSLQLPTELLGTYDTALLFPLPQFISQEAYKTEILRVAKELRELYVRERISRLSEQIKAAEEQEKEDELEPLRQELSTLFTLIQG